MPATTPEPATAQQLDEALADLKAALARASDATARLKALLPEIVSAGSVLDQIANLVGSGARPPIPTAVLRPPAPVSAVELDPIQATGDAPGNPPEDVIVSARVPEVGATTCFRIEFESAASPLDLRTVDDAISAHPAVRDVALLDYDGRRAALKVWITPDTTPAEVQSDLQQRAPQLFTSRDEISIVALEDVA